MQRLGVDEEDGAVLARVEVVGGGVKQSGHGREKGFETLYGFSTLKTVAIHHG